MYKNTMNTFLQNTCLNASLRSKRCLAEIFTTYYEYPNYLLWLIYDLAFWKYDLWLWLWIWCSKWRLPICSLHWQGHAQSESKNSSFKTKYQWDLTPCPRYLGWTYVKSLNIVSNVQWASVKVDSGQTISF